MPTTTEPLQLEPPVRHWRPEELEALEEMYRDQERKLTEQELDAMEREHLANDQMPRLVAAPLDLDPYE